MKIILLENMKDKRERTYDIEEVRKSLKSEYYGTLGDPEKLELDLSLLSHVFKNVRIEKNNIVGDLHILDTPMGKILKELVDQVQLKTSIRAIGNVNDKNQVSNLEIFGFDMIS